MEKRELTKAMRWQIAEYLADDRLDYVNGNIEKVHVKNTIYSKYIKRVIDVIVSVLLFVITLPINIIIGIVTFFDVGFPVFFKQERLGKEGKIFTIIKFRNMRNTKDEHGELLPPNQRITSFGRFVRKTSLDELLNFWSIIKGDMSLIGPRPLVPEYYHRYNNRHVKRLCVRPGLECPPRNRLDHVWTWQEQFENDIWYVENISFITDCKMVWYLIRFTFDKKSAKARSDVQRGTFMGYDFDGNAIRLEDVPQTYIDRVAFEMNITEPAQLVWRKE